MSIIYVVVGEEDITHRGAVLLATHDRDEAYHRATEAAPHWDEVIIQEWLDGLRKKATFIRERTDV